MNRNEIGADTINQILQEHKLGKVKEIKKIEIGFTNKIYLINNRFILKVCQDRDNEKNFEREAYFYKLFKDKLPVPKIRIFDNTKKIYPKIFMIYPKIQGNNLYSRWHLLTNPQRKKNNPAAMRDAKED